MPSTSKAATSRLLTAENTLTLISFVVSVPVLSEEITNDCRELRDDALLLCHPADAGRERRRDKAGQTLRDRRDSERDRDLEERDHAEQLAALPTCLNFVMFATHEIMQITRIPFEITSPNLSRLICNGGGMFERYFLPDFTSAIQ
jgi:hypothetical protein